MLATGCCANDDTLVVWSLGWATAAARKKSEILLETALFYAADGLRGAAEMAAAMAMGCISPLATGLSESVFVAWL